MVKALMIEDGPVEPREALRLSMRPSEVIDCNGALIAPGLIDLQINGGFGVDFSKDMKDEESVRECIRTVARKLLAHGNKLASILNVCWSDDFLTRFVTFSFSISIYYKLKR